MAAQVLDCAEKPCSEPLMRCLHAARLLIEDAARTLEELQLWGNPLLLRVTREIDGCRVSCKSCPKCGGAVFGQWRYATWGGLLAAAGAQRSPVHVRAFVLLGLHGVEELLELCHVGLGNLRLRPAVRQIREACVTTLPVLPAITRQPVRDEGQLRQEALCLRHVVDHDKLALVRPTVPLQEDPGALVAQQPQLRAAVGGRAVVGHLQLAPAHPVLRQEEIVREV